MSLSSKSPDLEVKQLWVLRSHNSFPSVWHCYLELCFELSDVTFQKLKICKSEKNFGPIKILKILLTKVLYITFILPYGHWKYSLFYFQSWRLLSPRRRHQIHLYYEMKMVLMQSQLRRQLFQNHERRQSNSLFILPNLLQDYSDV